VAFHTDGADQSGGRRLAIHEFAQRDGALVEDLGLRAHEFQVDGYVLGADYFTGRDALIAALDEAGSGTLVHPYRGDLTVYVADWRVREMSTDGGIAYFSLTFTTEGLMRPTQTTDTASAVEIAAAAAAAEGEAGLVARFSVSGVQGFVAEGAAQRVAGVADRLQDGLSRLQGGREALSSATLRIQSLRSSALSLVRRVPDLGSVVAGVISSARLLASTPPAAFRELRNLIGFSSGAPAPGQTPSRMVERANGEALDRLVTLVASAEAVRAAAATPFRSYDEAIALRDDLSDRIDHQASLLADAGDDAGYSALRNLRLAMVRDVTRRGGSLSRVFEYSPTATEPALVTAHRLYGDATRAREIVERNVIRHPGFVPGGQALEVLSDV
jgi:prophage DNA circulation protein